MNRFIVITALLSFLPLIARAQPGAEDTIRYRDRAKNTIEVKPGPLVESVAGVEVMVGGKKLLVSPADIIAVTYGKLAGVEDKVRQELNQSESRGAEESYPKYAEAFKAASTSGAEDRTKRYLEFKTAMAHARLADTKTGDEFKAEAKAAIERLNTVARSYKTWEVWPAARTAARLQAELGNFNDAATLMAAVAKLEGLPVELKNEAKLDEAAVLFRSGIALSAEPAIVAAGQLTDLTDEQKSRVAVYQAALVGAKEKKDAAKVQAAAKAVMARIDAMKDSNDRAAAHNVLGELFLMADLPQEAKWQFCWVDAVHNQDRDEKLIALGRLSEIFEKLGEKERAATYRERLVKEKAS